MRYITLTSVFIMLFNTLQSQDIARGADVGWLSEMEAAGRIWRDSNGVQKDVFDILPDYCINSIRLRVWVDPEGGWSGKQDVINLSKRAIAKGYRLMIDFHYSDSWADPGQQTKPAAWVNYTIPQLAQAVYDHTHDVLTALKNEGITPEWVQIGNETNDGMLWPEGRASLNNNANLVNYALFVDRGYQAVKDVFATTKVVVHVANGYDNGLFRWNIGGLVSNNARFDVIAMSMYPDNGTPDWPQYATQALANMQDMISSYNKEVIVAEIGMPTNQPQAARQFVEQVIQNVQSLPNNRGLGVFWWEPQAYNWRGYGKVAWNGNTGANAYRATEAMKGFQYNCNLTTTLSEVVFRVDMSGQNTSNGVYITGTMTEQDGNWQLIPMTHEGNNIYSRSFFLAVGQTGAYYYLNANDWSARETVPTECAVWWDVDRGYDIPDDENYEVMDVWGSCEPILAMVNRDLTELIQVYPNPFDDVITLHVPHTDFFQYKITSCLGILLQMSECAQQCDIGNDLGAGIYLLEVIYADRYRIQHKIVKR